MASLFARKKILTEAVPSLSEMGAPSTDRNGGGGAVLGTGTCLWNTTEDEK
jgi:hypothetical protein